MGQVNRRLKLLSRWRTSLSWGHVGTARATRHAGFVGIGQHVWI